MRIVLINPCSDVELQTHRYGAGHLGLGYVGACLQREGHEVIGIDAKYEQLGLNDVVERVATLGPRMVGVTSMTHEICHVGELCAELKRRCPEVVTVVGGPHPTALPERTLHEFSGIDVVVHGEGEKSACELAGLIEKGRPCSNWRSIQGIAYRFDNAVQFNGPRPLIDDLDALPRPAWDIFPKGLHWPIYAGRGCPFRCVFCQRVLGDKIRMRSVDNVLAEIDDMERELGVRSSWFQDETFGVNRRWTVEFLEKHTARNRQRGYVFTWKANSRANLADAELYRRMAEAGCYRLDFGVESGSEEILKRIHKAITRKQARAAVRAAASAGIRTSAFFIIGHPGETWKTALATVLFAPRLRADDIAVGVMVPYPGTEVWEFARRGEWGYKLLSEDWRVYDKYFGNALALETLSHRQMELLQVLTYIAFYLGTFRPVKLTRFLWKYRLAAWHMALRLLPVRRRDTLSVNPAARSPITSP